MAPALQRTPAVNSLHYERRRPEETTLYRLVQEHLESFLVQVEAESGAGLPEFVKAEFDAFLECGILAHGFLRLRCGDCTHEKLVAFFCKRRGFCPSCGARRMAETAAHLVDCVIPPVPVRQWVLSLPIPLRLLFAAQPQLLAPLLQVIHRVIDGFLVKRAGFKLRRANTGAVTLIQRFRSAAEYSSALPGARRRLPKLQRRAGLSRGGGSFYGRARSCAPQDHHAHHAFIDAPGVCHRRTRPDLPCRNRYQWRAEVSSSRLVHLSYCVGAAGWPESAALAKPAERSQAVRPRAACQRTRL